MKIKNIALVGNPNCGKTSLFNTLTGTRQKVANYAGVTVERKEGSFKLPSGDAVRVLDLPGTYSLKPSSLDEEVTRAVCLGELKGEILPFYMRCRCHKFKLTFELGSRSSCSKSPYDSCIKYDG
jgi:ferrous iron transport protein B